MPTEVISGESMYAPKGFRVTDLATATGLIRRSPFGTLLSIVDGEPMISYAPFSIVRTEPSLQLCAHLAKANPHMRHLDGTRVRVLFSGSHGYISPRWYTTPTRDVPTWNYSAVHCSGVVQIATDEERLAILDRLVTESEIGVGNPWSLATMEREYLNTHVQHIVAFYVNVDTIDAKFKLSQNRTPADRNGAIAGLRVPGPLQNIELADAMERASLAESVGS